jgi:hypothetical protein
MFCVKCGESLSDQISFCPKCGTPRMNVSPTSDALSQPVFTPPQKSNKFWTSWSPARRGWFVMIMVLTVLAGLNGQNIFQYVTGIATGQVTLSVSAVENEIESGVQKQAGITVTATCPNPLMGKPGEVRQCTIQDSTGTTAFVDITIQNTAGDVTWQVRN